PSTLPMRCVALNERSSQRYVNLAIGMLALIHSFYLCLWISKRSGWIGNPFTLTYYRAGT
ncbi:hypothetical protein FIBSPDRAFT_856319, partial [Athelia psychrophila]